MAAAAIPTGIGSAAAALYRCRAAHKLLELDDVFHLFDDPHRVRCVLDLAAAPGAFAQVAIDRMLRAAAPLVAPSQHHSSLCLPLPPDPLVVAVDLQAIRPMQHCVALRCNTMDHARIRRNLRNVLQQHRERILGRANAGCRMDDAANLFSAPQVVVHDGVSVVEGQHELSVTYAQNNMALGALRLAVDVFQAERQRQLRPPTDHRHRPSGAEGSRSGDDASSIGRRWGFVTKALPSVHHNRLLHAAQTHFREVVVHRPQGTRADSRESYLVAVGFRGCSGVDWKHHSEGGTSGDRRAALFSLPPNGSDLRHGRQVMWHCFGCKAQQMGARPCAHCGAAGVPAPPALPQHRGPSTSF